MKKFAVIAFGVDASNAASRTFLVAAPDRDAIRRALKCTNAVFCDAADPGATVQFSLPEQAAALAAHLVQFEPPSGYHPIYVVKKNHTLGYLDDAKSPYLRILAGSASKGGAKWKDGLAYAGSDFEDVRAATIDDFKEFLVSPPDDFQERVNEQRLHLMLAVVA